MGPANWQVGTLRVTLSDQSVPIAPSNHRHSCLQPSFAPRPAAVTSRLTVSLGGTDSRFAQHRARMAKLGVGPHTAVAGLRSTHSDCPS